MDKLEELRKAGCKVTLWGYPDSYWIFSACYTNPQNNHRHEIERRAKTIEEAVDLVHDSFFFLVKNGMIKKEDENVYPKPFSPVDTPREGDRSTWIDTASGETGPAEFRAGEWRER